MDFIPKTVECRIKPTNDSVPEITVERCANNMCITMTTNQLSINIIAGQISVRLNRCLTMDEAWRLGAELMRVAKEIEDSKEYNPNEI
jgi:hypothetical protein